MSSIDNKSGASLPKLPAAQDAAAQTDAESTTGGIVFPPDTAADLQARELIAARGGEAVLAMMGMTPAGLSRVLKGEPSNKFSTAATITSTPPPLPLDRAPITPATQAHYAALSQDMSTAMAQANPSRTSGRAATVGASATSEPGASPVGSDFMTQLSTITEEEAKTPAGQAKIDKIVANGFSAAAGDLSAMGAGSMMQAFMILRVENKTSGKEVQSTLQDLATDARNSDLKKQQLEGEAASAATKKAAEKQKKMGVLAPLIEAIVAIVSAIVSIVTLGAGVGLAVVLGATAIGFLAGGAVGGAKKGNGFDIASAITGAGIAGSVAGFAGAAVTKLLAMLLTRVGMQTAAKASAEMGSKLLGNMSTKASLGQAVALGGLGASGEIAKGVMNYNYAQMLIDAKKHQANGKMAKVMADMMQNQWTAIQGTLSGIAEHHTAAVAQIMAMMKAQFSASQKAVSQISG